MGYIKIYRLWLPYACMSDPRGFISKPFGNGHSGIDSVGNEYGNRVCAVVNGTVTAVYFSETLGNVVEYGAGRVKLALYHLAQPLVAAGDRVAAGSTLVGVEGATGSLCSGKHLHTSLWIGGVLTDPEPYLCGQRDLALEIQTDNTSGHQEENEMAHQAGDLVTVSGRIYSSAWGAEPSIPGGDRTYTVTAVIDLKNVTRPYQLGKTGFCSDSDIRNSQTDACAALKSENAQLKQQLDTANAKLDAVRKAVSE